jgi:hypothetical protein
MTALVSRIRAVAAGLICTSTLCLVYAPAVAESTEEKLPAYHNAFQAKLNHLFALSWCNAWIVGCLSCTKQSGTFVCSNRMADCSRATPDYVQCTAFDVEKSCRSWSDGCNTCSRWPTKDSVHCTAMDCPGHEQKLTCLSRD